MKRWIAAVILAITSVGCQTKSDQFRDTYLAETNPIIDSLVLFDQLQTNFNPLEKLQEQLASTGVLVDRWRAHSYQGKFQSAYGIDGAFFHFQHAVQLAAGPDAKGISSVSAQNEIKQGEDALNDAKKNFYAGN